MKIGTVSIILSLLMLCIFPVGGTTVKTFLDCNFNKAVKQDSKQTDESSVIYENFCKPHALLENQSGGSGNRVFRLIRTESKPVVHIGRNIAIPNHRDYEVSIHCNLEEKGIGAIWFCDEENKRIGGLWLRAGRLLAAYDEKAVWVPSGINTPKNKWFTLKIAFDNTSKKYQIKLITSDQKSVSSKLMPFLSKKSLKKISFITCPPTGSSILFDDLKVTYNSESSIKNRVNALDGARIISINKDGKEEAVPMLIDESIRSDALFKIPLVLIIDLAKPVQISTLRLYDGAPEYRKYPSGCCQPSNYIVEGLNEAGQWRELMKRKWTGEIINDGESPETMYQQEDFSSITASKLKITIKDSSDTLKRTSGKSKEKTVILREIALWGKELPAQSDLNNNFKKNIYGELRLPVYQNQNTAELYLYNVKNDKKNHKIKIEIQERYSKKTVKAPRELLLSPGENIIKIDINDLPTGEYAVILTDQNNKAKRGGQFKRLLRIQRMTDNPDHLSFVGDMTGKKLFFPDAHYLNKWSDIKFSGIQAKVEQVVKPDSVSDGFIRMGTDLYFDKSGKLNLHFITLDRFWKQKSTKKFIAVQSDNDKSKWKISKLPSSLPQKVKQKSPLDSLPPVDARPDYGFKYKNGKPPEFQLYDPAIHGPVKLNQVKLQYVTRQDMSTVFGVKQLDWKIIEPPPFSTWPIWNKAPGEAIILTKEPLLVDGLSFGEFEDKKDSNDNTVGQWLSDDGKTLYYSRACKLKRFPPFTAKYDNIHYCSRIIKILSTQDGVNWKYNYMVPPDKNDPPVAQHYGARVYRVPQGNGLRQAFVYRYRAKSQQISVEIAYSWDGGNWHRYPQQPAFIENGKPGSWNGGMVFIGQDGIVRDGIIYQMIQWACEGYHFYGDFYYFRSDMNTVTGPVVKKYFTGRDLESWPFFKHFDGYKGIAADIRNAGISVGIASYRQGGLFYMSAEKDKTGSFVSRLLTASKSMSANIIIDKNGFFSIDLVDEAGKVIPGYSRKLSHTDNINLMIFNHLPKVPFRIRAELKNTKLFSLNF